MIYAYANPAKSGSVAMCERFVAGVKACGQPAKVVTDCVARLDGAAAFYGVQRELLNCWRAVRAIGIQTWWIDNGYFQSKWKGGDHYRITANGMQHSGNGQSDGKRWAKLGIEIKPWRRGGWYVLIAQQSPWWYELHGTTIDAWTETAKDIAADWPIKIRGKPTTKTLPPIDWSEVKCVLTHSSNVALDGLVEGVPCLVTGNCAAKALAGDVDYRTLAQPDSRLEVFQVLADNQWTLKEIEDGTAWRMLNP